MQRNQRSNCQHVLDHRNSKGIPEEKYFCFTVHAKTVDYMDHNKLWKIIKEMEILDHLTCLLRNLHVGQGATVKSGHGTMGWFKIEKRVQQGCTLSPCLVTLYAQ